MPNKVYLLYSSGQLINIFSTEEKAIARVKELFDPNETYKYTHVDNLHIWTDLENGDVYEVGEEEVL